MKTKLYGQTEKSTYASIVAKQFEIVLRQELTVQYAVLESESIAFDLPKFDLVGHRWRYLASLLFALAHVRVQVDV